MFTLRQGPRTRSEAEKSQGGKSYNCSELRAGILAGGSQVGSLSERLMNDSTMPRKSIPLYYFAAPNSKSVTLSWSSFHVWTPRTSSAAVLPCKNPCIISLCKSPWIHSKPSSACFSLPEAETMVVLSCSDLAVPTGPWDVALGLEGTFKGLQSIPRLAWPPPTPERKLPTLFLTRPRRGPRRKPVWCRCYPVLP